MSLKLIYCGTFFAILILFFEADIYIDFLEEFYLWLGTI